jgi:hypothetical protein
MKFLKSIGILLLILAALVIVLMFVAPTKMGGERSMIINAPEEIVWEHICSLEKQNTWGPWGDKDPNMKVEFTGQPCSVGSKSKWVSDNKEVGVGEQTITVLEPMSKIESSLQFLEPWESTAKGWTKMEKDPAGGVKVTWGFESEIKRPFNIMTLFMNFEKAVNEDFDAGLTKLKAMAEKAATDAEVKAKELEMMNTATGAKQTL